MFTGEIEDYCDVPGFTVSFEAVIDGSFSVRTHGPDALLFYKEHASSDASRRKLRLPGYRKAAA